MVSTSGGCANILHDDFYVTCSSCNTKDYTEVEVGKFAGKTPGHFTFQTDKLLTFCQEGWQVGLAEISFFTNFHNVTEDHTLIWHTPKEPANDYWINRRDWKDDQLNTDLEQDEPAILRAGWYPTIDVLLEELNTVMHKRNKIWDYKYHKANRSGTFYHNPYNGKLYYRCGITDRRKGVMPILNENLENILKMNNNDLRKVEKEWIVYGNEPVDVQKNYHKIMVECDMLIGETSCKWNKPILRIIDMPHPIKFGEYVSYKFSDIEYKDIIWGKDETEYRSDRIDIKLNNEENKIIPFIGGNTTVKLHFRNKLYKGKKIEKKLNV